jgi:hypothetical protein
MKDGSLTDVKIMSCPIDLSHLRAKCVLAVDVREGSTNKSGGYL